MKSRFNEEVDAVLEGVWDVMKAGGKLATGLTKAALVGTGALPINVAYGDQLQSLKSTLQNPNAPIAPLTSSPTTPSSKPATTPAPAASASPAAVPIKNIANFDTKLKNIIDTSNLQPADKTALKSALQGLKGSATRQLTNKDVVDAVIAALR